MTKRNITESVSDALVRLLAEAGTSHAFGLIGGAIAPFARALQNGPIEIVHCRHEAGAAFAALEGYFTTGRPGLVFTTTGPGLTNALTGLAAARWEGGKVVLVSAASPIQNRGRWAFQETSHLDVTGAFPSSGLFHYSALLDDVTAFPVVANRLIRGLRRPGPFVAHLQIPLSLQPTPLPLSPALRAAGGNRIVADSGVIDRIARTLSGSSFVIWAGFGAREGSAALTAFAEKTGAPVMCSPRGKGVFPEDHPLYLGVTGLGGHAAVDEYMTEHRPDYVLVLGTRLGEMTSSWDHNMLPREAFIHVDIDPDVFGAAYPDVTTVGVQSDVGEFLTELLRRGGAELRSSAKPPKKNPFPKAPEARAEGPVRPQVLLGAMQRHMLEEGQPVTVMSEAGNAFAWATHWLRFSGSSKYRVSMGFGSMGHAVGAALGIAVVGKQKGVALLGDGAMLMNNEVSTAVQHGAPAVWVVLNDSRYGMIHQGMQSIRYEPFATAIPEADFAKMADAMGAKGIRVVSELELPAALETAMREPGPVVVDVVIDGDEPAPARKRNQSLLGQGAN